MSATDTPSAHHVAHRDEDSDPLTIPEHDDGSPEFISFSESAPLRPFSLLSDADGQSSFLSLTPDPSLEVPQAAALSMAGDSSFLSFTDTPPASVTPDYLSVVQEEEEEEEEEEDIGLRGETKLEEEVKEVIVGDRDEEIDLGDAILLESGRSENVVVEVDKDPESDSEYVAPTPGEQTSFYYDKELKRWVGKKPGL
ncbi:hypothetical protein EXIGLDRAFT_845534 [Exidia glandulosa HHB12029]|uniref:Uncharacterized protein n=1 Tax=Exidia glandulosa HHB12029 TaxID=1314781 RepID=A0A165BDZ7_EXIGL|nr:hypothetical protein EXIGLDRAFT_845534 [Exidia glandulosa HHB12029]